MVGREAPNHVLHLEATPTNDAMAATNSILVKDLVMETKCMFLRACLLQPAYELSTSDRAILISPEFIGVSKCFLTACLHLHVSIIRLVLVDTISS